ncbi:MAG: hypothetical protein GY799_31615, partial [Desulfobulbaceae bacterium]|nr:hypothetical protein [Desulfobulbaceae bacterium]
MGLTEIAAMRGVLKGAKRGVQSAMQVIQVLNEKERIAAEKAEKDLARRNKIFAEGVGKLDPQGVEELQSNLGIPDHLAKESRHLFGQDIEKGNDLVGLQRFLTSTDVRLKPMAVPGFPQEGETQEVTPEMKAQALAGAQGITE